MNYERLTKAELISLLGSYEADMEELMSQNDQLRALSVIHVKETFLKEARLLGEDLLKLGSFIVTYTKRGIDEMYSLGVQARQQLEAIRVSVN